MVGFPVQPLEQGEWEYAAKLGAAVILWNATEGSIRELLRLLARGMKVVEGSVGAWILVTELGSRQLSEALQAFASEVIDEAEGAEAVRHVALYFDRTLAYRNYYVHGISRLRPTNPTPPDLKPVGTISSKTAKGKLVSYEDEITLGDLDAFMEWVQKMRTYAFQVHAFLIDKDFPGRRALPEKPPLPATLVKRRPLPPMPLPQHPASTG